MEYYLSLGSNLGNRLENLARAEQMIERQIGKIHQQSCYYSTPPWGREDIHPFINACLEVRTSLLPHDVLTEILSIEHELGRVRTEKWGNRTIDIDILLCGKMEIQTEELQIPHPLMHQRNFVLAPLLEIAPHFVHPVLNKTIEELYIHDILQ